MCFASASERVNDLSHSENVNHCTEAGKEGTLPGRRQIKGFSPVWDRMCEIKAKRDVWVKPLRRQDAHSQV